MQIFHIEKENLRGRRSIPSQNWWTNMLKTLNLSSQSSKLRDKKRATVRLPLPWNHTFGLGLLNNQAIAFKRWSGLCPSQGTALLVTGGVPSDPGRWHEDLLKGSIHSSDLLLDQMTFKELSSTWGFRILFLLCTDAGNVSHCLNQTLRMDRSTLWNVDGAHIYFVFEFLEAVFVFAAVWSLTFCNIWSPATLSLFTVKSMEKLTSWQCSAKSKVKPLTGEQTQSFHLKIVIWLLWNGPE